MRIVVSDANLASWRSDLESALPDGTVVAWPDPTDDVAIGQALISADVLVGPRFTAEMGEAATNLRLVQVAGAGTDKIDVNALPHGAKVANTFHHEDSITEYVVAATVMLRRGIRQQDAALRRGEWVTPAHDAAQPWVSGLAGATVGFVGFGHIGARTWELFKAFRAHGMTVTRRGEIDATAQGLEWAGTVDDIDKLLEMSDVVVVSAPLTPETTGMIGGSELSRMGPSAVLVNVGRGPLVDQDALYAALRDGAIGGAAIDVWYDYPPAGHTGSPSTQPFHELSNVLMTPHSSGLTRQTFDGRVVDVAENINRLAAGRPLRNVVAVAS
ncbi:Phosphoglycerate dehydrogenase [Nakamurella panacisegetis]|uniref:Phosphoglycerate dehydrogenase n=1 Tax=Nakamurella panacisegetis TaxID=1090615 RepID=A0A1H0IRX1_9ACTN|nr:2-hydroxyacid dehydrogenase [Nakamurella panacisegetis]SDO34125.1 Phosphoglycerate dehydrogenase [Nakamurella panacisegetis]